MTNGVNRSNKLRTDGWRHAAHVDQHGPWIRYRNAVSAWIAIGAVLLAPLPFGSVDDRSEAVIGAALSLSLATCDLNRVSRRQIVNVGLVFCWLCAFLIVLAVQQWSDPPGGLGDPIWQRTAALLNMKVTPRLAATAGTQWSALGSPLLFGLVLLRFILFSPRSRFYLQAWHAFAYGGAVYAVYALVAFLTDPTQVLGRSKVAYAHDLTGTFINRNTAACFFGCLTVLWLTILLSRIVGPGRGRFTIRQSPRVASAFLFLIICAASTVLTSSRAGVALTAFTMVAVVMVVELSKPGKTQVARILTSFAFCLAVPVAVQVFGERVAERVSSNGLFDADRMLAYRSTISMIRAFPWAGVGLGNFPLVFPAFRDPALGAWGVWDRAHNTLLELTAEMGVPFAGLTILIGLSIAVQLCRGVLVASKPRELGLAACGIAFIGAAHSMVDFSLQIPGFAALWAAVVGCGLAAVSDKPKRHTGASKLPLV